MEGNDASSQLKDIKQKNQRGLIVAYLNINSFRKPLKSLVAENIDILTIAETRLDANLQTGQFSIEEFRKPFRYDRNANGGGLLVYVREKAPCKELKEYSFP